MEYTKEDLAETKRQIASVLHKLRETVKTLEAKEDATRYKSQITLAKRRIRAFEIADHLIEKEMEALGHSSSADQHKAPGPEQKTKSLELWQVPD